METRIPVALQPLINAYPSALELLHTHFYGISIHGSLALDTLEEQASDIDIVVSNSCPNP
jgi:predicted nucleotidyltransferase